MNQVFGYMGGDASTADHCTVGTVDVWDCSDARLVHALAKLRGMRDARMIAILNLHRVCNRTQWDDYDERLLHDADLTWTARLDLGALDKLDAALTSTGLWSVVRATTAIDEPYTRSIQFGQNLDRCATNLRLVHGYLKQRWPHLLIYLNLAAKEYLPEYPEFMPQPSSDAYGADVVGFDIYSDALPLGDTRASEQTYGSYKYILGRVKRLCPGKPILLVPDGKMFPGDTLPAKLQRISDIHEIAQRDPWVVGLLPYRLEELTPEIRAHYKALAGRA